MLENKTEINLQAAMALQKALMKRTNWLRYLLAAVFLLNAGIQIFWTFFHTLSLENVRENGFAILVLLVLAVLMFLMPHILKWRMKKRLGQQLAMQPAPLVNHYFFQPDGMLVKDDGVENGRELLLPYEKITRFLQDETYYFLYIKSMNRAYILKQDAFIPSDNVQVMACLQEKLAHCKGIR